MEELNNSGGTNSSKKIIIALSVISGVLLLAFVALGIFTFLEMKDLKEDNRNLAKYIADNFELDLGETSVDTKPTNPSIDELSQLPEGPKLVRNTPDGEELVMLFKNDYDTILQWDQWLFAGDKKYGQKNDVAKVRAYNVETGESKTIFDLNKTEDFKGQTAQYINNLDIFDGKLFISLGGYMMDGGIFYLELSDEMDGELNFVGKVSNAGIQKTDGGYVVTGGEGDACWSRLEIYTIAKDFSSLGKVLEIEDMCGEGEKLLYRDGSKFIIGALEKKNEGDEYGIYRRVGVQDVFESRGVGQLINEDQMPAGIRQIKAYEEKMFLVGDWLYEYDYVTEKIEKIVEITEDMAFDPWDQWGLYSYDEKKGTLCFNENYQLNLATKLVTKMADKCYPLTPDASPKTIEEKIGELDLPETLYFKK